MATPRRHRSTVNWFLKHAVNGLDIALRGISQPGGDAGGAVLRGVVSFVAQRAAPSISPPLSPAPAKNMEALDPPVGFRGGWGFGTAIGGRVPTHSCCGDRRSLTAAMPWARPPPSWLSRPPHEEDVPVRRGINQGALISPVDQNSAPPPPSMVSRHKRRVDLSGCRDPAAFAVHRGKLRQGVHAESAPSMVR